MVENRLNLLLAEMNARQRNQQLEQPLRRQTTRSETARRQPTRRNTRRQQPQSRQIMRLQTDAIGSDCPICLNTFLASDIIVDAHNLTNGEPSCHYFHKNCLMQICNRTPNPMCPLCRMPINCNDIHRGNRNLRQSSGGMRKKRKLSKRR
jgi:hypothetical protein